MKNGIDNYLHAARVMVHALWAPVSVGASALVESEGRIVLVRHSYTPGWRLPGGGVERHEPPATAVLRELREEIGLTASDPPELFGLYVRKHGFATNLITLYRVRSARFSFKPNWEIRALTEADPAAPPDGTTAATRRRLAEMAGNSPPSLYW